MLDHRRRAWFKFGSWLKICGASAIPVVTYIVEWQKSPNFPTNSVLTLISQEITDHAIYILTFGFAAVVAGEILTKSGQPVVKKTIQCILDSIRSNAFSNKSPGPENFYRVTLFKRVTWSFRGFWQAKHEIPEKRLKFKKYPWAGWVIPVMRSGQLRTPSTAVFFAPKVDCHEAEGMAGRAWVSTETLTAVNLHALTYASSKKLKNNYKTATYTPIYTIDRYLIAGRALPLSMTAYQVLTSDGEPWGSIVIDSREAGAVDAAAAYGAISTVSASLSVLLEAL